MGRTIEEERQVLPSAGVTALLEQASHHSKLDMLYFSPASVFASVSVCHPPCHIPLLVFLCSTEQLIAIGQFHGRGVNSQPAVVSSVE